MKAAIKEHLDFVIQIRDEPLKVLEVISTLMYTPVRARYPCSTLAETISSFFNLRQSQDEKLVDFIERFTQENQLVRTQLDKRFLNVFIGNTIEYNASTDVEEQAEMKNDAFDQFMAILFLQASDQTKYGKMQDDYRLSYANKKDDYPKSVKYMVDVMRHVKVSHRKKLADKSRSEYKQKGSDVKAEKSFAQEK